MIDQELEKFVVESLKEDIKSGDHTSLACINKANISNAKIIAKKASAKSETKIKIPLKIYS